MISILLVSLAAAAGAFTLLWLISLPIKDSSIVDPFWGASYVLVAWVAWSVAEDPGARQLLLAALVTVANCCWPPS
jgi:steroid 5-alpha reductase family enzyme